jgi:ribonuclease E
VTSVEPSIDAAFVDYGAAKDGFLPFDEVATKSLANLTGQGRATNRSGLKSGDWVLVQVTKEEVGKKGASLTMHVSLPGRFVVLMPFSDRTGISRKLGGEERARLRSLAQQLVIPEGYGCIVRTVGEDEHLEDLQADLDQQVAAWESIVQNFQDRQGAGEVHVEAGLALRFVRDYMTSDVGEVIVEDETSYRELAQFLESRMPQRRALLKRYSGDMPLFLRYGVERQIEALLTNKVVLPSGGSIIIGQTEALVAIDVNSGRMKSRDIEDTAFRVNLEAAREIARQVVLRDLGGILIVDFIDMESEAHKRAVEEELKAGLKWDKARLTFTHIQEFGLLAFSRQRLRQSVDSGITLPCPTCAGSGRVRSPNLLAMSALRKIRERLATQGNRAAFVEVTVPVEVGNFLNNRKREALTSLERKFDVLIDVIGDPDALPDDLKLTVLGDVPQGRKSILGYEESEDTGEGAPAEADEDQGAPASGPVVRPMATTYPAASPGKGRSLFRGLISKFLGLEEMAEVPPPAPEPARRDTAPQAPYMPPRREAAPAAPPPPPMPPRRAAPPAPEPAPAPRVPAAPRSQSPSRPAQVPRHAAPAPRPAEPKMMEPLPAAMPRPDFEAEGPVEPGDGTRKRRRRRRRRGKGGAGEGTEMTGSEAGMLNFEGNADFHEGESDDQAPPTTEPSIPVAAPAVQTAPPLPEEAIVPVEPLEAVPTPPVVERKRRERSPSPRKAAPPPVPAPEAPQPEVQAAPEGLPEGALDGEEGGEAGGHKRRRRRRRGKGSAGEGGEGGTVEPGPRGSGASRPDEDLPEPAATIEPVEPLPAGLAADGEAVAKKRPRHRGGRGRKKADGTGGGSDAPPPEPSTAEPDAGHED